MFVSRNTMNDRECMWQVNCISIHMPTLGALIHSIYIRDSKLLAPVVYFAEPVKTSFCAVWAEPQFIDSGNQRSCPQRWAPPFEYRVK